MADGRLRESDGVEGGIPKEFTSSKNRKKTPTRIYHTLLAHKN